MTDYEDADDTPALKHHSHFAFWSGLAIMLLLGMAIGSQAVRWGRPKVDPNAVTIIDRTLTIDKTDHETAALTMLRLGVMDWQTACAWQEGKDGATRSAMFRACTIRYHIGEPLHDDRRAGE